MALGSLRESFPDAALIRLSCPDAVTHPYGLAFGTAHVVVDLLSVSQAVGKHGVYVREGQRVVRLDDRLGSGATPKGIYHNLQQNSGVADARTPGGSSQRGTVMGSIVVRSERGVPAMTKPG